MLTRGGCAAVAAAAAAAAADRQWEVISRCPPLLIWKPLTLGQRFHEQDVLAEIDGAVLLKNIDPMSMGPHDCDELTEEEARRNRGVPRVDNA